jgi:hypothetical protein
MKTVKENVTVTREIQVHGSGGDEGYPFCGPVCPYHKAATSQPYGFANFCYLFQQGLHPSGVKHHGSLLLSRCGECILQGKGISIAPGEYEQVEES